MRQSRRCFFSRIRYQTGHWYATASWTNPTPLYWPETTRLFFFQTMIALLAIGLAFAQKHWPDGRCELLSCTFTALLLLHRTCTIWSLGAAVIWVGLSAIWPTYGGGADVPYVAAVPGILSAGARILTPTLRAELGHNGKDDPMKDSTCQAICRSGHAHGAMGKMARATWGWTEMLSDTRRFLCDIVLPD